MCPYKKYRQRENVTPWISADIYRNMRYRDYLVNLYNLTKNNLYLTLMKRQRNVVNSMVETAKKSYITTLLNNNSSCPKKFWKHVNIFSKGDNVSYQRPTFVDHITDTAVPHGEEATFLNDFFCNITTRLGFIPNELVDYSNNYYMEIYSHFLGSFDLLADPQLLKRFCCLLVILTCLKTAVSMALPPLYVRIYSLQPQIILYRFFNHPLLLLPFLQPVQKVL